MSFFRARACSCRRKNERLLNLLHRPLTRGGLPPPRTSHGLSRGAPPPTLPGNVPPVGEEAAPLEAPPPRAAQEALPPPRFTSPPGHSPYRKVLSLGRDCAMSLCCPARSCVPRVAAVCHELLMSVMNLWCLPRACAVCHAAYYRWQGPLSTHRYEGFFFFSTCALSCGVSIDSVRDPNHSRFDCTVQLAICFGRLLCFVRIINR